MGEELTFDYTGQTCRESPVATPPYARAHPLRTHNCVACTDGGIECGSRPPQCSSSTQQMEAHPGMRCMCGTSRCLGYVALSYESEDAADGAGASR
jgi:hypothetical protein